MTVSYWSGYVFICNAVMCDTHRGWIMCNWPQSKCRPCIYYNNCTSSWYCGLCQSPHFSAQAQARWHSLRTGPVGLSWWALFLLFYRVHSWLPWYNYTSDCRPDTPIFYNLSFYWGSVVFVFFWTFYLFQLSIHDLWLYFWEGIYNGRIYLCMIRSLKNLFIYFSRSYLTQKIPILSPLRANVAMLFFRLVP